MSLERSESTAFPETADVETSSADYARRFAGPVGDWFLELQRSATLELLRPLPAGGRLLDVGGGHAQLTAALVAAGYEIVVVGSAPACAERLKPWIEAGRCRFEVGNVVDLPYPAGAFDAALSFRLLPHVTAWRRLLAELCRVSRRLVVVDYPSRRSLNAFAGALFAAKQRIEGNTRPFTLFRPQEVARQFAAHGFGVTAVQPQFLWPMVVHRVLGTRSVSRALEAPGRWTGLTRWFGSPVIVRAERVGGSCGRVG